MRENEDDVYIDDSPITPSQAHNLYTSHFLSTWNTRTYEFASILFTATTYPDTLMAISIRGIVTTLASLFLSPLVGTWIDHAPSRLKTLLGTITVNRLATILACLCWLPLIRGDPSGDQQPGSPPSLAKFVAAQEGFPISGTIPLISFFQIQPIFLESAKHVIFAVVVCIGVLENLSGSANMISMERDWIPTIAVCSQQSDVEPLAYSLTHLNAVMRRIDLMCKLFGPIAISLIIYVSRSVHVGVLVVGGMSLLSWNLEWWCARRVWHSSPRLQRPKTPSVRGGQPVSQQEFASNGRWTNWFRVYYRNLKQYFGTDIWIPSMALAVLHLSILSYSGPFITHLLNTGYSLPLITGARAISGVVEISSTAIMPWGVQFLSRRRRNNVFDNEVEYRATEESRLLAPGSSSTISSQGRDPAGLERLGLWGLWGQLLCLVPVVLALRPNSTHNVGLTSVFVFKRFFPMFSQNDLSAGVKMYSIFIFLSISRLGLWTYDLTVQQLSQTRVPADQRSSFAGTEYSFVALFQLLGYIAVAVLSAPVQFEWLATGSIAAVALSTFMYTFWLRRERGHLVHLEKIGFGRWRNGP